MPRAVHCAAVDLGATSGRVIVGTWANERLALTEVHRFPNAFRSLGANDYWDLPHLWSEVRTGLVKAKAQFPKLASVGVDTWGVDHVLVDRRGRLVFPTHAYRDARTQRGLTALQRQPREHARIHAATGIPAIFYNSSLQLAETVASFPAIKRMAARCLFLPDYFNFLLSGRMANEVSIASTSQLLSLRRPGDWSRATLRHFGIPAAWFSRPIRGQTPLGEVRALPELRGTTVVAVPGHDTACAYDAMPARTGDESLFISSGTWSLVGFESDAPVVGDEAWTKGIANERTGDGAYRPLKNVIGLWLLEGLLKDFKRRPQDAGGWEKLFAAAEKGRSPAGLLDVTDSAFANPASMRGAIDAQLRRRGLPTPADLPRYVRLICESLGHGHATVLRDFERLTGKKFSRILMVGGGARNRLLCQATADAAGVPLDACELEGSATGNVTRQLLGLGAVESLRHVRERQRLTLKLRRYEPR